ncbi:Glycosyl hydrolases 32 N-terminal domain family protein [Leishmania donovani]|uniref:beta-fructofuranosidase n=1 Tax=Leishmania donovani TaxID=5661 RepID=A0A504XMT1_LEIDO|nr:Glycosyl hydrolases 32 N-terminal domain family protein [Leishmania donovani]
MQAASAMATDTATSSGIADLKQESSHEERLEVANHTAVKAWSVLNKMWYPDYHMASFAGWMGVPGGLCYHNGLYHVFYQYNPFSENWGPMHWGHVTSEDLVHWQHQPIALAPGELFDHDGCFSGSSVSYNNKLYIFYTGHTWRTESEKGSGNGAMGEGASFYQQQCVAVSSDGVNFEKLGAVVRPPPGYVHFRDPKVWQQDGRWWMVCGARDVTKDLGQLLLFATEDLLKWDDTNWQVLGMTEDKNVFMWECPDLFRLDQMDVFLYSPQGMRKAGYANRNRFQSGYLLGSWNTSLVTVALSEREAVSPKDTASGGHAVDGPRWLTSFDVTQRFREIDRGHDFYAPQTLPTKDGRRLIIGWMDMWESPMPTRGHGWSGCLTLPRELILDPFTGSVRMVPPKELLQLRCAQATISAQRIQESTDVLLVEDCTAYELDIAFNMETSTAEKYGLWLGSGAELYVDAQSKRLVLNRHYPQHMLSGYRSCEMPTGLLLQLHVFIDRSSIEVFVNNGEATFSSRVFPDEGDRALRVFSVNGTADMVGGTMWKLKATVRH